MKSPELKLFRAVITQAIEDAMYEGQDRYKRKIAICFKNSIDINAWLVKEGLAVAYKKYSRRYSNFEKQARDQKKGIWVGQFDMPWDWRKKKINYSSNNDS